MDTQSDERERAIAQGIQRQKNSEAAGAGTFVIAFLVVAALCGFVLIQTHHASGWYVIGACAVSVVVAGMASSRAAKNSLNR